MTLKPGTKLGPHEILSLLGVGGMGEVYKARDTRLNRIVAIKVLPAHLADRVELRDRFKREAETIANLKHPHICVLYDFGHQDGNDFLVMEYLESETLAQRLLTGRLPLDQVLEYAIEIADALDKAHRKGVTHRDLKPGNIMLTKEGTKLLDFGLAKLREEAAPANVPLSQLPTAKSALTEHGTILGTLQYMAPEQVEGKTDDIDARTDIFSFGAMLYEMVTGQKTFEGKTQVSLISSILKDNPPPMSSLQPVAPPALDTFVKRCLAKERDDRWQTARDLCLQLKWIAEGCSQAALPALQAAGAKRQPLSWIVAAIAVFVLAIAIVSTFLHRAPTEQPTTKVSVLPPEKAAFSLDSAPAISPDGRVIIYRIFSAKGTTEVWILPLLGDRKPVPFLQSQVFNHSVPRLSPDGRWVSYQSNESGRYEIYVESFPEPGGKWQVSTGGGVYPRWSRDGKQLFFIAADQRLTSVAVMGGSALEVGAPTALFETHILGGTRSFVGFRQQYDVSPDGQRFLINVPVADESNSPITLVLNWTAGLKK